MMSTWIELPRVVGPKEPVTVSLSLPGRRGKRRSIYVLVRPNLLEGGLSWWRAPTKVSVKISAPDGTDLRMRIAPGGEHPLFWTDEKHQLAMLRINAFPWISHGEAHSLAITDFTHSHDHLEFRLPFWARRNSGSARFSYGQKPH
jgi:hypothetical protein